MNLLTESEILNLLQFEGISRTLLESRIADLCHRVQVLQDDNRKYRAFAHDMIRINSECTLPHWICPHCNIFNGEAKERLAQCRNCGFSRPSPFGIVNADPENYL